MKYFLTAAIAFLLVACTQSKEKVIGPIIKNGIVKVYRDDGRLHKELAYKNDTLHGLSKTYHPDGKLYL